MNERAAQFAGWFSEAGWETRVIPFAEHFLHLDVTVSMVADGLAVAVTDVINDAHLDWFTAAGIRLLRSPGWDARAYRIPPAPATGLIGESDRIELGDRTFTVLHTPGHSPGHLSFFEEKTGTLIAQDVVYDGELVDDCYHSDIGVYIQTMRRLRELDPAIVHGGHGPSFGRVRFRQLIDAYLRDKGAW